MSELSGDGAHALAEAIKRAEANARVAIAQMETIQALEQQNMDLEQQNTRYQQLCATLTDALKQMLSVFTWEMVQFDEDRNAITAAEHAIALAEQP